jgi:hypothetical protein
MSGNIDILKRLPDVAAIGRTKLQSYCDEWLQRPIAREFGVSHLIVGSDLMLMANVNLKSVESTENGIFVPICELLDYIIEQHFFDHAQRRELHAASRDIRNRWGEVGFSTKRWPAESAVCG